ncbi:MAG: hypothetical protein IPK17_21830 [Chloroflexi bacterium]|uniref:hypothetical protein n=1 Tax=Candidatus Flexifilum breve TaxID=3140694 RepID=UPI0031365778|nr:hypothetical protein [Chloroflexota bacterium]
MLAFTIIKGLIKLLLTTKTKRSGVTGYLAVGSNGFEDYVAMGSGLRQHGYPAPDSDLNVAIGGGGYSQIGRLVVGGQGEGGGSTAEDACLISSVGSGGASACSVGCSSIPRGCACIRWWVWAGAVPASACAPRTTRRAA